MYYAYLVLRTNDPSSGAEKKTEKPNGSNLALCHQSSHSSNNIEHELNQLHVRQHTMADSKDSFQKLDKLSFKLHSLAESDDSDKNYPKIHETLCSLFILLFDFTETGQVQVAEKCGGIVVQFVSNNKSFKSDENIHIEIINQSLLIISALCNYDRARCLLIETTPIMKICIESLSNLQGNDSEMVAMRDKLLSCLSCIIRGFVIEALEAGILL